MKSLELEVSIWQCTLIITLFGEGAFGRTFYTCFKHLQVLPYLRHYYKPVFEKRIFPPDIGMLACKILTDKKIWWQGSIKYPLVNKDLSLADKFQGGDCVERPICSMDIDHINVHQCQNWRTHEKLRGTAEQQQCSPDEECTAWPRPRLLTGVGWPGV